VIGPLFALITAFAYASNTILVRRAVVKIPDANAGILISVPMAVPLFFFILVFTGRTGRILNFPWQAYIWLSLAGILHSALTVSSPLAALAFWCLQLTTVTGLSGIIIYMRLSLSLEGYQVQGHEPSPSTKRLLQTWRFLHRWLAILLLVALLLHIIVAVRFGDLWILGGRS